MNGNRCSRCRRWTSRKSEFVGWQLCDKHVKWTHADAGCGSFSLADDRDSAGRQIDKPGAATVAASAIGSRLPNDEKG